MQKRFHFLAIVAALLSVSFVSDAPAQGKKTIFLKDAVVYGLGLASCGQWTAERSKRSGISPGISGSLAYESWLAGYMTGMSIFHAASGTPLKRSDVVAMSAWIDNYCAANPLKQVADAASLLIVELKANR
jgi:hypothetical protein